MKTTVPDKIKAHIIMTDTGEKTFFMRWLPVLTLTLCTFVFNTSEFIPIGLLTDIGRDFGRTEAEMGWLVTTYAWVVALMSLPLMLLASKMECRRLMMSVLAPSHPTTGFSSRRALASPARTRFSGPS